jgi:hypothetical protein
MKGLSVNPAPIVICSKTQKCLPVLLKSIELYVPEDVEIYLCGSDYKLPKHKTRNFIHTYDKGGDAWNFITNKAFEDHEEVVACADDVVLNPSSYQDLMADVELLKQADDKIATVAARTNYAKGLQNIRYGQGNLIGLNYEGEGKIIQTDYIAGIFHWVSKHTWIENCPIDWYSDDIWCLDQIAKGHNLYIARAYIHHVGSQTYGTNYRQCSEDSREWVKENRPDLYHRFFPE